MVSRCSDAAVSGAAPQPPPLPAALLSQLPCWCTLAWLQLALWWSLLENCSASVRSGDVLSALLFLLTGSNTTVGLVQVQAWCG